MADLTCQHILLSLPPPQYTSNQHNHLPYQHMLLSLSLTHIHIHTHPNTRTHTYTHTHIHTPKHTHTPLACSKHSYPGSQLHISSHLHTNIPKVMICTLHLLTHVSEVVLIMSGPTFSIPHAQTKICTNRSASMPCCTTRPDVLCVLCAAVNLPVV